MFGEAEQATTMVAAGPQLKALRLTPWSRLSELYVE
jgi:hypothetical protein